MSICDKMAGDALTAYRLNLADGINERSARALAACYAARKHGATIAAARDAIDSANGVTVAPADTRGILHALISTN